MPRRAKRKPRTFTVLARRQLAAGSLFLFAVALLAIGYWWVTPRTPAEIDRAAIDRQRHERLHIWKTSLRLPGTPDLDKLDQRLASHGVALGAPIMMRIFKREFELELWMARDDSYHLFATYPICSFSGGLGPKLREGDKQAPEGFYLVDAKALNPESRWHRSFNLGFPNLVDRAHARTGTFLMVHGGCSSVGCYAMTDAVIDEIWKIVTAALKGGQPRFQVQVYPFRLSEESLARYADDARLSFWRDLKRGSDLFESNWLPPRVHHCQGRYAFSLARKPLDGSQTIDARCFHDDVKQG
jgi:murein L,D-transpeptidase YafK